MCVVNKRQWNWKKRIFYYIAYALKWTDQTVQHWDPVLYMYIYALPMNFTVEVFLQEHVLRSKMA